jgi:hypothetical protein
MKVLALVPPTYRADAHKGLDDGMRARDEEFYCHWCRVFCVPSWPVPLVSASIYGKLGDDTETKMQPTRVTRSSITIQLLPLEPSRTSWRRATMARSAANSRWSSSNSLKEGNEVVNDIAVLCCCAREHVGHHIGHARLEFHPTVSSPSGVGEWLIAVDQGGTSN